MKFPLRILVALRIASIHLMCSAAVITLFAIFFLGVWYPFPYREISGGRELFFLLIVVDVVCGPLLTFVLYDPTKKSIELKWDLGLIVLMQLAALAYGSFTIWQARPIFLVLEVDRFKVILASSLNNMAVAALPLPLKPSWLSGPVLVSIREPKDRNERNEVLFESAQGGRDYADRPEFYMPYDGTNALKSLKRAKSLGLFLKSHPDQQAAAQKLADEKKADISQLLYLPVVARQDWVAVLDQRGQIQGFLKGDGF